MTSPTGSSSPGPQGSAARDAQTDAGRTRAELGRTVGALSDKMDVKAQARRRVDALTDRAPGILRRAASVIRDRRVALAVAAAVALLAWRRRRHR